jgi:ectoine hydroxylase-related dioxygenase (phytanoyl-CoA dioxygenase family)
LGGADLGSLGSPVGYLHNSFFGTSLARADLVGRDVKFHHSKLNFKASEGGAEVKWHQDIQFRPHTNYSLLTVGTYLCDCGREQGPLGVIPGSHDGDLFDQYNEKRQWIGCISDADLPRLDLSIADYLTGPAGSLTIHNCRTVHGSRENESAEGRPLSLATYSSADAMPYTYNPLQSPYMGRIVRGSPARWAHHDPRPCLAPDLLRCELAAVGVSPDGLL